MHAWKMIDLIGTIHGVFDETVRKFNEKLCYGIYEGLIHNPFSFG